MLNQLALPMGDMDRAALAWARVREACRLVAAEIGHKIVAASWGCTEAVVSLKLSEAGRHYLKGAEIELLKARDYPGRIVAAQCEAAGFDAPERKRPLEPHEKLAQLDAALNETLGAEVAELLRRKAGLL